jgi:uncharacterized protein YhdP
MPLAVGKEVRDWLRGAISGGKATDVTADAARRPAAVSLPRRQGRYFRGARQVPRGQPALRRDWPEITNIEGELLFSGQRMLITGKSGRIFGVGVRDVRAEIADIEQGEELLTVTGKAAGPTPDFLRFIEPARSANASTISPRT